MPLGDEGFVVHAFCIGEGVTGGDRLGVELADRQAEGDGVEAGPLAAGEVLRVAPFVERDRRDIAVEMDRGGPGIVVIAAEEPAGEDRLGRDREGADRVAERPADGLVPPQPVPVSERGILVDPHLDVVELVVGEIPCDRSLGGGRDTVVLDAPIPEDDLRRDSEHPAGGIEHLPRLPSFDRRCLRQLDQLRRRDRPIDDDLARCEAAVAPPAGGDRQAQPHDKQEGRPSGVGGTHGGHLAGGGPELGSRPYPGPRDMARRIASPSTRETGQPTPLSSPLAVSRSSTGIRRRSPDRA